MNILCIFAGQGYKNNELFDFFQNNEQAYSLLQELAQAMHLELQSNLSMDDPYTVQCIIGAYQYTLFNLIQSLLKVHSVNLAGYSLGEVNAFLASINATPQQVSEVLSYRTHLMTSLINQQGSPEYDLLFITGNLVLEDIQSVCTKHQCFIAIVNLDNHLVLGGTVSNLRKLLLELPQYHVTHTKFLNIHLPSHTPFYQDKKGLFYQFLQQLGANNLQYPILSPLQLGKIMDMAVEKELLDRELYTTLQWLQVCELIKEYNYDLIIDLGPGDAMTKLLAPKKGFSDRVIITASNYSSFSGFLKALHAIVSS